MPQCHEGCMITNAVCNSLPLKALPLQLGSSFPAIGDPTQAPLLGSP